MMDPLVLFHGFTGRGSAWDPVLQELMTCSLPNPVDGWSPDLPGHGSSFEVRPDSFEAAVDRITAGLERRFSRPIVLVGYSLGARLALGVAAIRPELLGHLVLISVQPGLAKVDERRNRADADAALSERILKEGLESFVGYWQGLPLFDSQRNLSTEVLVSQSRRRMSHRAEGMAWAVRTLSPGLMPDYRPTLLEWQGCPITLVSGELDEAYTETARQVAELTAGIEHRVIEGVGHNPVLERPRAVAELIAEVLTRRAPVAGLEVVGPEVVGPEGSAEDPEPVDPENPTAEEENP